MVIILDRKINYEKHVLTTIGVVEKYLISKLYNYWCTYLVVTTQRTFNYTDKLLNGF